MDDDSYEKEEDFDDEVSNEMENGAYNDEDADDIDDEEPKEEEFKDEEF